MANVMLSRLPKGYHESIRNISDEFIEATKVKLVKMLSFRKLPPSW